MPLLFVLVILAVLAVVAVVASGRFGPAGGGLPEPVIDRAPLGLPDGPLTPRALHEVRFPVVFRGYRMDQVDEVLDRCGQELAARDARIAQLERSLDQGATLVPESAASGEPAGYTEPA